MKRFALGLVYLLLSVAPVCGQTLVSPTADPRIASIRRDLFSKPSEALDRAKALRAKLEGRYGPENPTALAAAWIEAASLLALNKPDQAGAIATEALARSGPLDENDPLKGELLVVRGSAEAAAGSVQAALTSYQSAFNIFAASNTMRGQAVALQHIAAIYNEAHDYNNAIKYITQALELNAKEPILLVSAYNNAAVSWYGLQQYGKAETAFRRALDAATETNDTAIVVRILLNIADVQVREHRLDDASVTLRRALSLSSSGAATSLRPALFGISAELELDRGDIPKAVGLIDEAMGASPGGQTPGAELNRIAYRVFRASGDTSRALANLEAFRTADDRSRELAASANAALMSARFDFANQDLKITRLRADKAEHEGDLARARVRYHTMISVALGTAAAVISTLLAIGYLSISRSRNQVRRANASLQETNADLAKALAAKSEFLATTSHEIRTPLNGILGMTQVLLADRAIEPGLKTRVEVIHGAGETMRALVDDILDMAKMETEELRLHPAAMDLHRLLRDTATVWEGQAETKRIALHLMLDDAPAGIVADEVRLRQIVFNLMANAIKFTDRGQVRLLAHADQDRLVIRVEDSGIGIPADKLEEIFEAFRQVDGGVTRRHGGTGLGLAICRNLARAMGGEVAVESVLGAGSKFTLSIPLELADLPQVQVETTGDMAPATLAEARLLLIEPNPLSQGILRAILTPHVGRLALASDLGAAERELAAGVDHIVADAAAFEGDPALATRFVKTIRTHHITLLWPSPDRDILALLAEGGIEQVLAKPIAAPDLLAKLRMRYSSEPTHRELAA